MQTAERHKANCTRCRRRRQCNNNKKASRTRGKMSANWNDLIIIVRDFEWNINHITEKTREPNQFEPNARNNNARYCLIPISTFASRMFFYYFSLPLSERRSLLSGTRTIIDGSRRVAPDNSGWHHSRRNSLIPAHLVSAIIEYYDSSLIHSL